MNIFEYIPLLENYVFQTISEEGNSSLPPTDPRTVRFLQVHEGFIIHQLVSPSPHHRPKPASATGHCTYQGRRKTGPARKIYYHCQIVKWSQIAILYLLIWLSISLRGKIMFIKKNSNVSNQQSAVSLLRWQGVREISCTKRTRQSAVNCVVCTLYSYNSWCLRVWRLSVFRHSRADDSINLKMTAVQHAAASGVRLQNRAHVQPVAVSLPNPKHGFLSLPLFFVY